MNSTRTIDQFNRLAPKLMMICGPIMCLAGLIGNLLNICIFTLWSRTRQKSNGYSNNNQRTSNSPLYLLVSSIANLVVVTFPLLTRILFDGYQYRVTATTVFLLCKLRYYLLHTFDFISLTCFCLAIFDRYLISSKKVRRRELSTTKKRTMIIILLLTILIALHSIPLFIYYSFSSTGQCVIFSVIYSHYYLYVFEIFLHGIFPIIFLSIFGLLTFKQLRLLTRSHPSSHLNSDRQLARMLLLMSIAIILSSIPNCFEQIYQLIVDEKDPAYSSKFYLYHVITSILFYTNPVTSFYIFYLSTPNFRHQVRNLIHCNQHLDGL